MGETRIKRGLCELVRRHRARTPLASIALAVLILPLIALGHAQLLRSNPLNGAELAKCPAAIEVWFNELLEDGFNSIVVFPAQQFQATSRTNFIDGKPKLDRKDGTHLTAKVRALGPGDYIVEWRVLSRDGHSAPGRFTFRVLAPK